MHEAAVVPMFPLGTAFLPGDVVPLRVFEPRYKEMVRHLLSDDSEMQFGTVLIERGHEVGGDDVRRTFGVCVRVDDVSVTPEGGYSLIGLAVSVLRVEEWLADEPYPCARVTLLPAATGSADESIASRVVTLAQSVRSLLAAYLEAEGLASSVDPSASLGRVASGQWIADATAASIDEASWIVARNLPVGPEDRYALLSSETLAERVRRLVETYAHASEVLAFRKGSR